MTDLKSITTYLKGLQNSICQALEELDGEAKFQSDIWQRPEGGGGDSRVITKGKVFEKGGVNFSHVHGIIPDFLRKESGTSEFFHATGVSIVIHPGNPFVPVIHMNVRYFQMSESENEPEADCWFGGGIDLTPAYVFREDAEFFHRRMKQACDNHDPEYYQRFKTWCDEYFYIRHRGEMRGIGGIFYDHLRPLDTGMKDELFAFMKEVGNSFAPTYSEIVKRRYETPFSEANKQWQLIRRGRYAEFNLVYDRGTAFGLKTNGRIESILMSMPPLAKWEYDHHPEPGSAEYTSLQYFQPRDWLIS